MGYKILVVNDEPQIVKVLEKFLVKEGFEVFTALGGEKALEIIKTHHDIDLLILDIKMPKMRGLEILRIMKEEFKKYIPVIILTGSINIYKYAPDLEKIGYSINDILIKPVDFEELLGRIEEKLRR